MSKSPITIYLRPPQFGAVYDALQYAEDVNDNFVLIDTGGSESEEIAVGNVTIKLKAR